MHVVVYGGLFICSVFTEATRCKLKWTFSHGENGRKTSHYITTRIHHHTLLRLNYHTYNTVLLTFQFIEFQHLTPIPSTLWTTFTRPCFPGSGDVYNTPLPPKQLLNYELFHCWKHFWLLYVNCSVTMLYCCYNLNWLDIGNCGIQRGFTPLVESFTVVGTLQTKTLAL